MYPLLPWKWLGSVLTLVVLLAVYANDLAALAGFELTDRSVIRYLPPVFLAALLGFFGPTGYWAPWRITWRFFPFLNGWLPDLNGVWLGTTASNWPTIKKMFEAAKADRGIEQLELHSTSEQRDAIAIQITASLFALKINAALSSTGGNSYSIAAKPRRDQHTGRLHLSYVYEQVTRDHALTDEEKHMGAADLITDPENLDQAEGVYWTRRSWKIGLNTAGRLTLHRVAAHREGSKTLREYATDEKMRLAQE